MRRDVPCHHVVIYESTEGPSKELDYPAWLNPVWLAPDIVRVEIAAASSFDGGALEFGKRATNADLPFIELDLSLDAARQLAEGLLLATEPRAEDPDLPLPLPPAPGPTP